jgi:aminoglycoside phosphotransferase (APT) family kinase protein
MLDQNPEISEIAIDQALASRLIVTQFSQWADLSIGPVAVNGWDNRTFRLGEHMSIRLPSARRYSEQVEKEQFWLPRLAPSLPLSIPEPLAMGEPGCGYPWRWSIYRWLTGEIATIEHVTDLCHVAISLAKFLNALRSIEAQGGPLAGPQNFYRGGSLSVYDAETRQAIAALEGHIDSAAVTRVWQQALCSKWERASTWVHGDVSAGNLLVQTGKLTAVIDFGTCGIGDPACDLSIAWTFFRGESRQIFRATLNLDDNTWARGRGWTLWKSLITWTGQSGVEPKVIEKSQQVIAELVADYDSNL